MLRIERPALTASDPALGSLREALLANGESTLTAESGKPTPILVMGVERRCKIATDPNAAEGRPAGLYGNRFSGADAEAIKSAVTVIDPPTTSNIIAVEAPSYGCGPYRFDQIEFILTTALTGFSAAREESQREFDRQITVVIHTGFWGCGAYGGNRVLMGALQILAARMAQIHRLVYHTFDHAGSASLTEATDLLASLGASGRSVETRNLIHQIEAAGFEWGVSDGN